MAVFQQCNDFTQPRREPERLSARPAVATIPSLVPPPSCCGRCHPVRSTAVITRPAPRCPCILHQLLARRIAVTARRDRRHCRLSYRQLSVCRVCDSIEARWRHRQRPAAEHVCGILYRILYQFAVAYIQPCRSSSFIMRRHRREAIGEAIAI